MLESWLTSLRQGVPGRSLAFLRRAWGRSPGAWISVGVILFIGVLVARAHAGRAGHRPQIAAAFGAANTFYGEPQMSHDGSQFTYVATTETRSCALYICAVGGGQPREIAAEGDGQGYWKDDYELRAGPWSPDDSAFIYLMQDKMVIYPTEPGAKPMELAVRINAASQITWLDPAHFAFVKWGVTLCLAGKQPGGEWQLSQLPGYDPISSLTAVATNTLAWLENGLICRLNLDQNTFNPKHPFLPETPDAEAEATLPTNGLILWLDAATLQQPDQTPVNQLADLSPSRNTALADGTAPAYNAPGGAGALNNRGTIHFSSNGSLRNSTGLKTGWRLGITGDAPRTMVAVMRRAGNHSMLISTGDGGTRGAYFGLCDQNDAVYLPAGMVTDNRLPALDPDWHILTVVYDGQTQKGFVNGLLRGATDFPLNTPDTQVELGVRQVKSGDRRQSASSDGDFAELLIYNRALNTGERQQIEGYLSHKWFGGRVITAQSPLVWVDPQVNGITGFNYSKTTGQFLIQADSRAGTSLWRHDSRAGLTPLAQADFLQEAQWVGTNEVAYIGRKSGHNVLVLADASGAEQACWFDQGNVNAFAVTAGGGKLLFSGSISNEPANGLWQYDLATGTCQSLVAYSDHPYAGAERVAPFRSYIQWPSLSCLVYPPPVIERHKKYPLVITDTLAYDPIHGPVFQSALADCGAYVVIVERPYWYGNIEQWGTNVMRVFQKLKWDPAIDPGQVYLFAASAETRYLSELVEQTPGLWKGIILLNPTGLPDFSHSPRFQQRPKILIVAGGEEREEERFQQYQENALQDGVLVEYLTCPGEAHRFVGKAAKLERAQRVEQFIFEE